MKIQPLPLIILLMGVLACRGMFTPQPQPQPPPSPVSPTPQVTTVQYTLGATLPPPATNTSPPPPTATPTAVVGASSAARSSNAPLLRQLTTGGCCVQPFFSADSRQVLFIDKPTADAPVGIYGVEVANPHTAPTLVNLTIGFRNQDRTIVATLDGGDWVRLTRETTGESWTVNTRGNWPSFSPNGRQLVWTARDETGPFDARQAEIWLANLDGSQPQQILTTYGGGFVDWLSEDGQRLLVIGKDIPTAQMRTLFSYDMATGQRVNLFTENRLRGIAVSPQGRWILFFATFSENPSLDGLWLLSGDGTVRRQLELPRYGAYQWRDENRLLYIPIRAAGESSMQLFEVDVTTGVSRPLTDPQTLPFVIADGDWRVSPDGQYVAFVNRADGNIWLIVL